MLHEGNVAEMRTGEGKTLVATLPAYLNALTGHGVHIVTVNDYLAQRDSEWCAALYLAGTMLLAAGLVPGDSVCSKHIAASLCLRRDDRCRPQQ